MEQNQIRTIRSQLLDRRERLRQITSQSGTNVHFLNLLKEVDSALERMDSGTYGICMVCHDPIEDEQLLINPLIKVCLDHLSNEQRRTLENDLDLAYKIQLSMLPKNDLLLNGWEVYYHYEPAGAVSGDYCDIISSKENPSDLFFIIGDVSGKGIAASMLMSHLHAMFHSMVPLGLTTSQLTEHASRLMCESTMSSHYATLLSIKAESNGGIEICNAGHPSPLIVKKDRLHKLEATGMPIGLFCDSEYSVHKTTLESGDILLLYTDGLTESFFNDEEYGIDRLSKFVLRNAALPPKELTNKLVEDVNEYIKGTHKRDDLTIMAIRKS